VLNQLLDTSDRARAAAEAAEALAAAFVRKSFEALPAGTARKPLGSVAVVRGVTFDKSESKGKEVADAVAKLRELTVTSRETPPPD